MGLRLGFIGGHGHHYLRQTLGDPVEGGVDVAIASDGHDVDASRAFAKGLESQFASAGVRFHWFDDGNVLLDSFKPDVLSVGAVYGFNGEWNASALARNIPTVTDKPAAATWDQLATLRSLAAEDPSRILLTEFDFRCRPDFRAARAAVARGDVGEVVLITAQKSYRFGTRPAWYADRAQYGGTLLWVASHGIDAIEFVAGKTLQKMTGRSDNLSRPGFGSFEDHVALMAELDGGGTAIVHADFLRPSATASHGDDRLRVAGMRGVVEVRNYRTELIREDGAIVDITDTVAAMPSVGRVLLDTARGKASADFSTGQTLAAAEVLLRARDAVDRSWT